MFLATNGPPHGSLPPRFLVNILGGLSIVDFDLGVFATHSTKNIVKQQIIEDVKTTLAKTATTSLQVAIELD